MEAFREGEMRCPTQVLAGFHLFLYNVYKMQYVHRNLLLYLVRFLDNIYYLVFLQAHLLKKMDKSCLMWKCIPVKTTVLRYIVSINLLFLEVQLDSNFV